MARRKRALGQQSFLTKIDKPCYNKIVRLKILGEKG